MNCFLITPEQKAAQNWQCSPVVFANPVLIYGGTHAGKFAVTCDFLAPEVVAGSPENEILREVLESFPVVEIDPDDLRGAEIL
jgi:hypothetical protein